MKEKGKKKRRREERRTVKNYYIGLDGFRRI